MSGSIGIFKKGFTIFVALLLLGSSSILNFPVTIDAEAALPQNEITFSVTSNDIMLIHDNGAEIFQLNNKDIFTAAITQLPVTEQNGNLIIEGYNPTNAYPKITSELQQRLLGLEILLEQEQLSTENTEQLIEVMVYVKEPPSIVPLPDYVQVRFELGTILQALVPIDKIYELESEPNVTRISTVERPQEFGLQDENNTNSVSVLSPKQQLKEGILPENIICKEGLELIFKFTDNSPACVKQKTAEKLVERGWGTITN